MSGPIAINLALRLAVLGDGREVPITNLFDADGDDTERPEDARSLVCGGGLEWYSVSLAEFDRARVH